MRTDQIISGTLLVVGKDKIDIELGRDNGRIEEVEVEFRDHHIAETPCNPHHDELKWAIERRRHGLVLMIKWHVSSPRAVVWVVKFR
jgi:hypothetical protein